MTQLAAALLSFAAAPALASGPLVCTAYEACAGTACRDAAGMAMDFDLTYDDATADLAFHDPALPVTQPLQFRATRDGAFVYTFRETDLMVAVQIFEAQTPPRVRLAFGDPDAPEIANQVLASCAARAAS